MPASAAGWRRKSPACLLTETGALEPEAVAAAVLTIVHRLAGEGKIVLYHQPLQLSEEIGRRQGSVLENSVAEIAQLQATGQLDIRTDLTVTFIGDKRVLADVDALARQGYGEDAFGNNVETAKGALVFEAIAEPGNPSQ
jgi:hypothetical protein